MLICEGRTRLSSRMQFTATLSRLIQFVATLSKIPDKILSTYTSCPMTANTKRPALVLSCFSLPLTIYFVLLFKGKDKGTYTLHEIPPQKHSSMARVLKGSHSFTCTPTRLSAIGMSHTCVSFPSYSTHLTTPEGWKAELAWVAGYVVRQFTCQKAVTHPTTNQAQCRATALIETNALPLH